MTTGHQLVGLIKFLARDDWKGAFDDVLEEHFGPATEILDLDYDDIGEVLGDQWAMTLWGCAFEDFLTRDLDDGRNLAEVYLKKRGWKEDAQTRLYIHVLRSSLMSLYEVSAIVPGQSLRARDLIRGGEPIVVREGTATKTLKQWDRIAARIVPRGDGHMFAGGLLPFSTEAAAMLRDGIQKTLTASGRSLLLDDEMLRRAAPLFTTAWLLDVVPKALGEDQLVLHNADGDEVVFHEVRFPLAAGVTQKEIGALLDSQPALRRETSKFWNWLDAAGQKHSRGSQKDQGVIWDVTIEDGRRVLGNIEMQGRFLVLMVSSAQRAERGSALLQDQFGARLRAPLTKIETVDQMLKARRVEKSGKPEIPPDIATALVHDTLDRRYGETLDQPVGMIGDISPRKAVKTAKGRVDVADWLKFLENRSASSTDPTDPMATYDFGWMWRELGIEDLRR